MSYPCQKDIHFDDFDRSVLRTAGSKRYPHFRSEWRAGAEVPRSPEMVEEMLTLAALGIGGEGGEVVDVIKKHLMHDKPLDVAKLEEELGDLLFYLSLGAQAIGSSLEQVATRNVAKLRKRYPDGFDTKRANAPRKGE